jgi:hypothetical protein
MNFKLYNSKVNSKIQNSEILPVSEIFYGKYGEIRDFNIR